MPWGGNPNFCRSKVRRYLGIGITAIGAILLAVFVPLKFWMAILGIILILIGLWCI